MQKQQKNASQDWVDLIKTCFSVESEKTEKRESEKKYRKFPFVQFQIS